MTESTQELASRWQRLWGALLDGLIMMAIIFPIMWISGVWQPLMQGEQISVEQRIWLFIFGVILFFVLQGYLLAKHGQTIGKRIVGTRIVSAEDGQIFPLSRIFWLRHFPLSLICQIPTLGSWLSVIDVLFIFRKDKRCIHDLIAGTRVVNVNASSVERRSAAMNDDAFYDEVAKEIEANNLVPSAWTRAFAEADGNENRAKAIYIKHRVVQMAENSIRRQLEEAKRTGMPMGGDVKAVSWEVVNKRWVKNTYVNGDVTMGDKATGKMWSYNVNRREKMKWVDAVACCHDLTYAGYSDWRLPDKDELSAQLSQKGCFVGVRHGYYWSGTSGTSNACYAWYVGMFGGRVYRLNKASRFFVWPVRGGQ